jgi:hypothetical protein
VPYVVRSTPVADRQIAGLRGLRLKAYQQFEQELARQGCAALGYRLTGEQPLPRLCVKHLRGNDRVVVAFSDDVAWVLLVGPHDDGDQAANVYANLYVLAGVSYPTQPRTKPPCCDETNAPPRLDEAVIDDLVRRARPLRRPTAATKKSAR